MNLGTIATVIAICASAFGIFVAIDQLTMTTRQRRFAEFLLSSSEAEQSDSPQHSVLVSLRREMVARQVGASAVPAWTMAGDVITLGGIGCMSFLAATWLLEEPLPTDAGGWVVVSWPYLLLFLGGWTFFASMIRRIDERRRIADDFLNGNVPLTPAKNYELHGFKVNTEALQALWLTLGMLAITLGAAMIIQRPTSSDGLFAALPGLALVVSAGRNLRTHFARRRGAIWQHPSPRDSRSATPASAAPAGPTDAPAKPASQRRGK